MRPLVSIIIPIYNMEAYLAQCLDSILAQSYTHLEIILINDGSTDGSEEIALSYARQDSRILYIYQENQGGGVSRNVGLDRARGEYILCFDSDDYMRPFAIESLIRVARETKAQIVIAQSEELLEDKIYNLDWVLKMDLVPQKRSFNRVDLGDNIFGFCVGWAWDKLYLRDFIESNALRFEPIKSPSDDLYFTFMSLIKADSISVCDKVLFTHRKHLQSQEGGLDKYPTLFLRSLNTWQVALQKEDIFPQVERSFMNWSLGFCLWHLNRLGNKAHYELFVALKKAFYEMGIATYPKAKFYNKKHYRQMRYILLVPLWLHRLNIWRYCDNRGLFRIRIDKKARVIRLFGHTFYTNDKNL